MLRLLSVLHCTALHCTALYCTALQYHVSCVPSVSPANSVMGESVGCGGRVGQWRKGVKGGGEGDGKGDGSGAERGGAGWRSGSGVKGVVGDCLEQ